MANTPRVRQGQDQFRDIFLWVYPELASEDKTTFVDGEVDGVLKAIANQEYSSLFEGRYCSASNITLIKKSADADQKCTLYSCFFHTPRRGKCTFQCRHWRDEQTGQSTFKVLPGHSPTCPVRSMDIVNNNPAMKAQLLVDNVAVLKLQPAQFKDMYYK
jgi:hypothetical protein